MPASLPMTIAAQFAWAPIEAWASTAAGVTKYAARATARKSTRWAFSPTPRLLRNSAHRLHYLVRMDTGSAGAGVWGRVALAEQWTPIADWVRTYSERGA
jgi:hypothetical protein